MITFLASPKPFSGRAREHQYQAIRSWQAAADVAEVILYGDSAGIDAAGRDLGVRVVKQIACAPSGVPYFGAIAEHARQNATHELQIYLNCDILMPRCLRDVLTALTLPRFLMIGQRLDLASDTRIDPSDPHLLRTLRTLGAAGRLELHPPGGIDYFVFRRGTWDGVPPLMIGRAGYDGALLAHCLRRRIPLVDATMSLPALHPWHDYGHVAAGVEQVMRGEDSIQNRRNGGTMHSAPQVWDAGWEIRDGHMVRSRCRGDRLRELELHVRFVKQWTQPADAIRALWRVLRHLHVIAARDLLLAEVLDAPGADARWRGDHA